MIRPDVALDAIFLYRKPVDMRKGAVGLSALIEGVLQSDPFSGGLFVFINKSRDRLKIIYWESNGFVTWYKHLQAEKFSWPLKESDKSIKITSKELNWLLDGFNIFDLKPHQKLKYSLVS